MTEADLQKFLDENKDAIMAETRQRLVARLGAQVEYALPDTYLKTVNTFMAEEIAPELAKILKDQKGPIIAAVTKAAAGIGDELAKSMSKKAIETLQSYSGSQLLQKLMGGH